MSRNAETFRKGLIKKIVMEYGWKTCYNEIVKYGTGKEKMS